MKKTSEPLGVSFTLEELQKRIALAISTYGANTRIYSYDLNSGIALHVHFPAGEPPHVTFTQIEVPGPDLPPGERSK